MTRATGAGGIDGTIKENQLGFFYIYIQAKQWTPDCRVDRPEIRKFAGALQGEKAMKESMEAVLPTTEQIVERVRQAEYLCVVRDQLSGQRKTQYLLGEFQRQRTDRKAASLRVAGDQESI